MGNRRVAWTVKGWRAGSARAKLAGPVKNSRPGIHDTPRLRQYRDSVRDIMKPIRKAVFPVAGLGTRFLPATKAMPKEMLPVVDRPLI